MAHTKQSLARAVKRNFAQPEPGDLSEQDLLEIDRQFGIRKDEDCASFGQRQADDAQRVELQRDGGYVNG